MKITRRLTVLAVLVLVPFSSAWALVEGPVAAGPAVLEAKTQNLPLIAPHVDEELQQQLRRGVAWAALLGRARQSLEGRL